MTVIFENFKLNPNPSSACLCPEQSVLVQCFPNSDAAKGTILRSVARASGKIHAWNRRPVAPLAMAKDNVFFTASKRYMQKLHNLPLSCVER